MSESITGYIDHVIFRNEDNGYTVMVLKGIEGEEELTCVGTFPVLTMGASVASNRALYPAPGIWKTVSGSDLTEKMPEDAMAMERYLGSGAIKGIGAALAARIVRRFGADTLTDRGRRTGASGRSQRDQREESQGDRSSGL